MSTARSINSRRFAFLAPVHTRVIPCGVRLCAPQLTTCHHVEDGRSETLPTNVWEVLGGVPVFPGSRAGGRALGFTSTRLICQTRSGTGNTHALGQDLPRIRTLNGCLYCCPQARLRTLPEVLGK